MNKRQIASLKSLAGILLGISIVGCGGPAADSPAGPSLETNEVKIFRDEWGVPSIYARTEEAGYFGLAFAMMQDQPERLLAGILASRGELAANVSPEDLPLPVRALFPSVDMMVESDYQAKLWRLSQLAEQATQRLKPQLRDDYQQFINGVNAYFDTHPEKLPAWAPSNITIADLIAYPHYSLWSFYQA
ncbi:MAG TPA: penicillin acylase family protein, partial [Amphiplicatus sp.]|nr:penicillin acylase family protein [Amphiplicatus sp.]